MPFQRKQAPFDLLRIGGYFLTWTVASRTQCFLRPGAPLRVEQAPKAHSPQWAEPALCLLSRAAVLTAQVRQEGWLSCL